MLPLLLLMRDPPACKHALPLPEAPQSLTPLQLSSGSRISSPEASSGVEKALGCGCACAVQLMVKDLEEPGGIWSRWVASRG